jgi:hypothetical protein
MQLINPNSSMFRFPLANRSGVDYYSSDGNIRSIESFTAVAVSSNLAATAKVLVLN